MLNFRPPKGWKLSRIPPKSNNRSAIYIYGVRVQLEDENESKNKCRHKWYCMASSDCRYKGTAVAITATSTTPATDHLRAKHGIGSVKTEKYDEKSRSQVENIAGDRSSFAFQDNPARFMKLAWAKSHVIGKFVPFSFMEDKDVWASYALFAANDFPVQALHRKAVKRLIVELYVATKHEFAKDIVDVAKSSVIPTLSLNVDLWASKTSGEKFLGVRVWWTCGNWKICTRLLAVKSFQPASSLSDIRLSNVLKLWLDSVLHEFGIDTSNIFACVTDSGSDVKRLCNSLLDSKWEWCVPNMLNCTLFEGFGVSVDKSNSKNPAARDVFCRLKKVLEHLNKSLKSKRLCNETVIEFFGDMVPEGGTVRHEG